VQVGGNAWPGMAVGLMINQKQGKDCSDPYEQHEIKPRLMLLRSSSLQAAQLPRSEAWGSRRQQSGDPDDRSP
jgi:hypothetical protein